MRAVGIGLLGVGLLAGLWAETPCQAAGRGSLEMAVVQATVGHPPGPPSPDRYWWYHPPVHRTPCVVLPPPPSPPPRRVCYAYPPVVYYPCPYFWVYEYLRPPGTFYYSTPRSGVIIRW